MSSILTVSQLNKYVQFKIQSDVKLSGLAVKGEISNFSVHYKLGHAYFSIKDENSVLKCVMFSRNVSRLRFEPTNGMNVLVMGNLEVYERDGVYQLIASDIQPMGVGAIHTGIEQLKKKLADKGVFDSASKKTIPYYPRKIAVVTSLTGAALQDILNILQRRFPIVEVNIFPAQVQGSSAAFSISKALKAADKSNADTIILARGGGAQEDLMPFNSEEVAMAVHECSTPIISAVGHETDVSISDLAADMRAPTPSAAAELAVPDMSELVSACDVMKKRLDTAITKQLVDSERKLHELNVRLSLLSPFALIEHNEQLLSAATYKLEQAMAAKLSKCSMTLDKYAAQLNALSPFNILQRGYSITTKDKKVIYSADELSTNDVVEIRFGSSKANAKII